MKIDKDQVTVQVNSEWHSPDEVNDKVKEFEKWGVHAEFNDGGDHFSSWTLVGHPFKIGRILTHYWSQDWQGMLYDLFDDPFDVKALVAPQTYVNYIKANFREENWGKYLD